MQLNTILHVQHEHTDPPPVSLTLPETTTPVVFFHQASHLSALLTLVSDPTQLFLSDDPFKDNHPQQDFHFIATK